MNGEKYLPTKPSKVRCLILTALMLSIYSVENFLKFSFISSWEFIYVFRPAIWIGIGCLVLLFPKVYPTGKLRHKSFINLWAFNFAVIFIVVSIAAGIIDGFGKSPYSQSIEGIIMNAVFVGSMILGREQIRSYFINNLTKKDNCFVFIIIALFMTFTSISANRFMSIKGYEEAFKFTAQYLIPEFSINLMASYLVFLGGPMPAIIYIGAIKAFHWFSPILPDLKWITASLIGILCPIFSFTAMQRIYLKESNTVIKNKQEDDSQISWMATSIISILIVWFTVGVFPIYPSVIVTGSMEPVINPGDIILVKKWNGNYINTGDIIQFRDDNILIAHRVIDTIEDTEGMISYKTKGDNNSRPDTKPVNPEQIKGKIIGVVPKLGWPTLLIKDRKDIPLERVVF